MSYIKLRYILFKVLTTANKEKKPSFSIATSNLWPKVGLAVSKVVLHSGDFPCFSKVQTPVGPRKSGIPADVLMPAPEKSNWKFEHLQT